MPKILKAALVIIGFGWLIPIISQFGQNPVVLLLVLILNVIIFYLFWKGTAYVTNNPQSINTSRKTSILRWFLALFFSIFGVEIGVVLAFIVRFINDEIVGGPYPPSAFYTLLSVVFALPFLYVFSRVLKFSRPQIPTLFYALFWLLVMAGVGNFR